MRTHVLILAGISALTLAGCVRPNTRHQALKPISRLDCPQSQGSFHRASMAPDGRSCDYTGPDGAQLQMKLVSFTGDPDATLQPTEDSLKAMLPAPPPPPAKPAPAKPATPASSGQGRSHDNVNINLPGISIHADDQNANVHVAGVRIDANDAENSVHINGGGPADRHGQFTVDADDSGAVIRARSFGPNFEESLILASKTPGPQGWRSVGYEALGPKAGPIVVATFQSKADNHDTLFQDVKALTRKVARGQG